MKEAACQRVPNFLKGLNISATGYDEAGGCTLFIKNTFDPSLPLGHFMELVENYSFTISFPFFAYKCAYIFNSIVIEILHMLKEPFDKGCFA